jgi:hypothetical protein
MKFCVHVKETGEKKLLKSISQIARDLDVSYAIAYKNLNYSLDKDLPRGKKLMQKLFDSKYEIKVADE